MPSESTMKLPGWVKVASAAGLFASLIALVIAAYPIVDVVDRSSYAVKICTVVVITNILGWLIYRTGRKRGA